MCGQKNHVDVRLLLYGDKIKLNFVKNSKIASIHLQMHKFYMKMRTP